MVNKNSQADHVPERTCVVCRKKASKDNLLRFVLVDKEIVFDPGRKVAARGYYICNDNVCIEKLDKWKKKKSGRI